MRSAYIDAEWSNVPLAQLPGRWCIVQTIPRHERRVARGLSESRIGCYVPLVERVQRKPCGEKYRSVTPLFGGYVFARSVEPFARADCHPKVRSSILPILPVVDQLLLTLQLGQLQQAEMLGMVGETQRMDLVVGRRCIVRPPHKFQGVEGVLIRRNDRKQQFVIEVTALGAGYSLDIPSEFLEATQDAAA